MSIITKASYEGQEKTDALSGKLTFEQGNNRIIGRDQNNVPRLLILGDGSEFSMKVSKDGQDVLSATGDQLIFNSNQNIFKIVKTGTLTIPAYSVTISNSAALNSGNSSFVSIPHGLGYKPGVIAFAEDPSLIGNDGQPSWRPMATIRTPLFVGSGGGVATLTHNIWVDDTFVIARSSYAVYIAGAGFGSTQNIDAVNVKYYLLQESAN